MADKNAKPKNYDVGYGKPPQKTQFKRGASGNPHGRPNGSLNLGTALERELAKRVIVNENGVRRTVSKREAAIMQLVNKALSGDPRAMQLLLGVLRYADGGPEPGSSVVLEEADQQVANEIIDEIRQSVKESDDETDDT